MTQVVGANGEVLIEPALRAKLGVEPGSVAVQRIVNNHLEIEFMAPRAAAETQPELNAMSGREQRGSSGDRDPTVALTGEPVVKLHNRSLLGILAPHITRRPAPDESWHDIKERAWHEAVMEEADRWRGKESASPMQGP
jgi:hypothetical protein